jgi:SAM-dependent methyltransferase
MELKGVGFIRLYGIDPFTPAEPRSADGLVLRKVSLDELAGEKFDIIMMHHVFEHLPDPIGTLRTASALLADNGVCLIRIPVAHSWASQNYGPFWLQHDAPRHLFLHTDESMHRAAEKAGLRVTEVVYDSSEAQIWGSELYKRDESLLSVPSGIYGNPIRRLFSPTFRRYRAQARRLNRAGQGDQAAFYLSHLR